MMGVPTFYTRLLDSPGFTRELAGNMRIFISGSAPLLPQTFAAFAERTGHAILERYGMTEAGMIDRKSVVEGKSVSVGVDRGGGRSMKKKNKTKASIQHQ